jgi:undecaprenyl diphosphate synthase
MSTSFAIPSTWQQSGVRHVAIILDGNGRWATRRGRPRTAGHLAGVRAVRRTIETARRLGLPALTLYAFSADNWRRPAGEVSTLMDLFRRYLALETARMRTNGIRFSAIGRRDRLAADLLERIEAAETETAACDGMHLRIAIDYSARDAITHAALLMESGTGFADPATAERLLADGSDRARERFGRALAAATSGGVPIPPVDLLIRTGGEQRLSDFMLWECAYAELLFLPQLWPDFGAADLERALAEFESRDRRFGGV